MWSNKASDPGYVDPSLGAESPLNIESARTSEGVTRVAHVAVIGKGMLIRGEIRSKESLHVDGEIEGNLFMADSRLSVSRDGRLGANVKAREIELMGEAKGNLEATSRITIRKGARMLGDLRAPGIVIEEGAFVKGKIEILNSAQQPESVAAKPSVLKAVAG